ncbi:MAG TPA: ATP-binding protein [Candidatus Baltobacteraceae bacterium]|nr:ATP-binding protein [Candidatus Baltobacteraceae bacterium]
MRALAQLSDAQTPAAKATALAVGALACAQAESATALLFNDDGIISATQPDGAPGFALRDGSAELRRLFLHALARFGDRASYVSHDQQRAFVGVSSTLGARDLLFVPLNASNRTLGVVALMVDGDCSDEERETLTNYCGVVSRILDTERALVAARRQSRDSQLLAMVNERLHKSLDRRDVLFGIVEGVRAAFSADRCFVYERTADGEHAAVVAAAVHGGATGAPKRPVALDADLRKAFGGLTVRRDDQEGGEIYGIGSRSAAAIPFVVDGHVEDALILSFDRPGGFDDADITALRSLAFHVGLALSNARLYQRERARRTQAETLERVVRILRDTQYVDEVLLVFVVTVSHELPIDCAAYALDGDALVRRASRVREPRGSEPTQAIERSILEPFLAVDEPSDAALLPRAAREALFDGRGGAMVPLRLEGSLWGTFIVRGTESAFDWPPQERATFFRTLGSHLEIALANAHAYEREMKRAQERETLAEAARTILSHTGLGSLADVMCRLAATLVRADRSCVLRWSGERYEMVGSFGDDVDQTLEESGFDIVHRAERLTSFGGDERRVQRLIDGPGYVVIPLTQSASGSSEAIDAFLIVGRLAGERFSRDDLRIMQEIGALLALALRNLELYEAMSLANRALQESSGFKDDLLAMLAHDFKGPLQVISGYCELLLESTGDHREEVETMFAQTQRLVRLSEDALVLAQTQSEGFSLARTIVDLGEFVMECAEATAPNNPRVTVKIPPQPVPVELDPHRFRHVIDNLVSNALKYSTGPVDVRVALVERRATIEVSDHGIGIPKGELDALFTRFGRASNARDKGISGSGIGLYVARKIVEVHQGTIVVRSKENEGSTFVVDLPTI